MTSIAVAGGIVVGIVGNGKKKVHKGISDWLIGYW